MRIGPFLLLGSSHANPQQVGVGTVYGIQHFRIVSVSELKESTFTTRQGETKLLSKRVFIINDGYDEIACEMLGDKAKTWGQGGTQATLWRAHIQVRVQQSENGGCWNNVTLNNLTPLV